LINVNDSIKNRIDLVPGTNLSIVIYHLRCCLRTIDRHDFDHEGLVK